MSYYSEVHGKCLTKMRKNSKKILAVNLKFVLESFPSTPYIFIYKKNTHVLLIWRVFVENWAFSDSLPYKFIIKCKHFILKKNSCPRYAHQQDVRRN